MYSLKEFPYSPWIYKNFYLPLHQQNMEDMELKNRKFKIFGQTWKLNFVDDIVLNSADGEEIHPKGTSNWEVSKIEIRKNSIEGKPFDEETIKISILHELMHALLDEGMFKDESQNEQLVEYLAKGVNSLLNQHVI